MTKTSESYGYNSIFPTKLRDLMKKQKVTHKKISEICSVKPQSVSQWANGETRPDILSLVKIAEFFNVSTDYLLGLTDVKSTNKATKKLCSSLHLSETAINVLQSNESSPILEHLQGVVLKDWINSGEHNEFDTEIIDGEELTIDSLARDEAWMIADALSAQISDIFNFLIDDYTKSLNEISNDNYNYRAYPFLELFRRFKNLAISNDNGALMQFMDSNEVSKLFATDSSPLFECFKMRTPNGETTCYYGDLKKLLLDATINDIVAKLHDIKTEALRYNIDENESEEETK